MSNRYAPIRTTRDPNSEMEAAFDSEDEDDVHSVLESHPLNPSSSEAPAVPGAYDFENVAYDYPPPGSPPRPSAVALPNEHGNTNGLIPSFDESLTPRRNWLGRTATSILPTHFVQRWGFGAPRPSGAVGGGTHNDGVFANVTAKPSRPIRIQDGDSTYIVPEDSRQDAPPSYAHAQADAVPPYWETIVHAPFAPGAIGEMIIDGLPTGSLFSFAWNALVSISFQFVGFLLTYLLHTTHAARLGSRAGLGVTLIQYGFTLRNNMGGGGHDGDSDGWGVSRGAGQVADPKPTLATAAEADAYYPKLNGTLPTTTLDPDEEARLLVADATTEWLSFFLMTVGWFILLTSILGFWRVKRWERNIVSPQRTTSPSTPEERETSEAIISRIDEAFPGLFETRHFPFLRQGLGFPRPRDRDEEEGASGREMEPMISPEEHHSEGEVDGLTAAELAANERLRNDLQAAGLL